MRSPLPERRWSDAREAFESAPSPLARKQGNARSPEKAAMHALVSRREIQAWLLRLYQTLLLRPDHHQEHLEFA
jgi:hypothetical protein